MLHHNAHKFTSLIRAVLPKLFPSLLKPLIRKSFLPNVDKTLTAQKTYLTSEERSVRNRKQTNILAATKKFGNYLP
jgi:hypothetical protein